LPYDVLSVISLSLAGSARLNGAVGIGLSINDMRSRSNRSSPIRHAKLATFSA